MPSPAGRASRGSPEEVRAAIERFLKSSRQPILLEPGEDPFPVDADHFSVSLSGGRLTLQVWDRTRNLVRRVSGVRGERPGRIELAIEKFGKRSGSLLLIDSARPANASLELRGKRLSFRERFRRLLSLEFPGWQIAALSTEANLEYSLSPVYPRALLTRGRAGLAALACPADPGHCSGALSFGLIWLDYLRHTEKQVSVEGLALFLPEGMERTTCLRMKFLDAGAARFLAFVCSENGSTRQVDTRDYGNIDTRLEPCRTGAGTNGRLEQWVDRLSRLRDVERIAASDGSAVLRVRGLPFARTAGEQLWFGLDRMRPAGERDLPEIEALAAELARLRSPSAADRENPLYRRRPEGWLESQVRAHLEEVDASLRTAPVYSQVPAFAGGERGVLDLVAVDLAGRLAVLELKASEDIHLPLQALDYWMRVKWHLDRNEFSERGYFRGIELSKKPPRLLLIAPSLDFHPATEAILRYLSPEVPVERIGLGVEWRRRVKVMFRTGGALPAR